MIAGCNFLFYSYLRHFFNYKGNIKDISKKYKTFKRDFHGPILDMWSIKQLKTIIYII